MDRRGAVVSVIISQRNADGTSYWGGGGRNAHRGQRGWAGHSWEFSRRHAARLSYGEAVRIVKAIKRRPSYRNGDYGIYNPTIRPAPAKGRKA